MHQPWLAEKLAEVAFIEAKLRMEGKTEEVHYDSVLVFQQPSVESLVKLAKSRDSMVEMRMHIRSDGSAGDHGTASRARQDQLVLSLHALTVVSGPCILRRVNISARRLFAELCLLKSAVRFGDVLESCVAGDVPYSV